MKTILITGCSSGFGLETARHFLERDWRVLATMRTPRPDVLPPSPNLRVLQLDVTDPQSIRRAVDAAGADRCAGQQRRLWSAGTVRADEHGDRALAVRDQHAGHDGRHAGRAAADAPAPVRRHRQRDIQRDLQALAAGRRLPCRQGGRECVHRVADQRAAALRRACAHRAARLLGAETRFRETARAGLRGMDDEAYGDFMRRTIARMAASTGAGTRSRDVAEAVWRAATDASAPLRLPAGADAVQWAAEAQAA